MCYEASVGVGSPEHERSWKKLVPFGKIGLVFGRLQGYYAAYIFRKSLNLESLTHLLMKNRNLYILLGLAFLLLLGIFILFNNAQRQVVHYKNTVTTSHRMLHEYQELSSNLKSAQIATKDFKGRDVESIRPGLLTQIERINQNLINLNELNTDPVPE